MIISKAIISEISHLKNSVFMIKALAPDIAKNAKPGQFCNIRVTEHTAPLLRRPFSICDVENEHVVFLINTIGEATKILSKKKPGEILDILGPLGNGFGLEGEYETAVIVGGGIGTAPFPFLIKLLQKKVLTFAGAKSQDELITYGLGEVIISTDDGSEGFHGNVVDLLKENMSLLTESKIKIFACGPNRMLGALKEFAAVNGFECEISTETSMACGFGLCQGCVIEAVDKDGYYLVCKDGPVFDSRKVKI